MVEPHPDVPEPTVPPPGHDDRPDPADQVERDAHERSLRQAEEQVKTSKAIVLHSGGIDSTTCLYMAVKEYGERNVASLSIHYGQRHLKEADCAAEICERIGVEHHIVELTTLPPSMLTDPDMPVPNVAYADLPAGVSPTYVPFRNGNMLSHVAAIAMAQNVSAIYFGAHAEDAQNWAYPDCTPEFIGAMANAIYIGTYHKVRLVTPLEWLVKSQIIQLGLHLGVPWKLTWSCYKGEPLHCGVCPTCRARRDGFTDAGVIDPTRYEEHPDDNETPF